MTGTAMLFALHEPERRTTEIRTARRLSRLYFLALVAIATISFATQVVVQNALHRQQSDAHIVNIAGRQRMLSQRLVMLVLAIERARDPAHRLAWTTELTTLVKEWKDKQAWLLSVSDGADVVEGFEQIDSAFHQMAAAAQRVVGRSVEPSFVLPDLLRWQSDFLAGMDTIVLHLEKAAEERVRRTRAVEAGLFIVVLLVLGVEGWWVFRPTVNQVRQHVEDMANSEAEKEALLSAIPDAVFSFDRKFICTSFHPGAMWPKTATLLGLGYRDVFTAPFVEQLSDTVTGVLRNRKSDVLSYRALVDHARDFEFQVAPLNEDEVLVTARDITEQRSLERALMDAGEQERVRLGHELHDDLCQQLMGTVMLAHSVRGRAAKGHPVENEIGQIAGLLNEGVDRARRLAKGLSPVILEDQGLWQGIRELVEHAESRFSGRCILDIASDVPVPEPLIHPLYRIVQEALNNAVQHSQADTIEIRARFEARELELCIIDNGIGLEPSDSASARMGLRIMRYRAEHVGARLEVGAHKPRGTVVRCRVPFEETAGGNP